MREESSDEGWVRWHTLAPIVSIVWTVVLLFMPPAVFLERNPPPSPIAFLWWSRMICAMGLVVFNGIVVHDGRRHPQPSRFKIACVWYFISFYSAVGIEIGILHWVLEYPYPFGLPVAPVQDWVAHWR